MNRFLIIGIVGILLLSGFVVLGSEDSSAHSSSDSSVQNIFARGNYGTVDNPITSFLHDGSSEWFTDLFLDFTGYSNVELFVLKNTVLAFLEGSEFSLIDYQSNSIPGFSFLNKGIFDTVIEGSFIEPGIYPLKFMDNFDSSRDYIIVKFNVVDFVFSSIPSVSNIISPVYSYTDDGDPYILSDDGQILNSSVSYPILGSSATLGADKWVDPNYRDPPKADHVITVTAPLKFKSNDPAYTLKWTLLNAPDSSDSVKAGTFAMAIGNSKVSTFGSNSWKCSTGGVEPCLPSWITYDAGGTGFDENSWFEITIRPALQQVSEDTHGDYWMYFETSYPSGLFSTANDTWLIKLSVDVEWAGGVIVPEKYNEFILSYDYGIGGEGNFSYRQIVSDSSKSYEFVVPSSSPDRSGYEFRGWSINPGSEYSDIGEVFVLSASTPGVSVRTIDNKTIYEKTIYGVWKSTGSEPVPLPNFLEELLELLRNPVVMGGFLVFVFLSAFIVRSRRI